MSRRRDYSIRFSQSARSTEARKIYGDRRRSGARKKGSVGTTVLVAEEGRVVDDSAEVEGDLELQVLEEVTDVVASKKTHAMKARSLAVDGEDGHPPRRSTGCRYHSFWLNLGKFAKARLDSWMIKRALAGAYVDLTWNSRGAHVILTWAYLSRRVTTMGVAYTTLEVVPVVPGARQYFPP